MSKFLTLRFVPFGAMALAAVVVLTPTPANATPYVMKLVQQGSNVVAIGSGAFDVSGLSFGTLVSPTGMAPNFAAIVIGDGSGGGDGYFDGYFAAITGPASFGPGGLTYASSESGDIGVFSKGAGVFGAPVGYVSGTAIAGTATWDNATFASLGVTPGNYVWTWGTGADQSFTLMVGNAVSVPEPTALGMFGFGVLLIGGLAGRRRRTS